MSDVTDHLAGHRNVIEYLGDLDAHRLEEFAAAIATELIAAVLVNKYCDHLPIHRQVGRFLKSSKVDIAESSVCRWRDQIADQLEDLADLMKAEIKQSYCINTDASPAPVRLPDEGNRIASGNMYVYIGGDDRPYNVFNVQPNQTAGPIYSFLVG